MTFFWFCNLFLLSIWHEWSNKRSKVSIYQATSIHRLLTSMASLSKMRSCRNSSSLIFLSWNSSSIWPWASSSCCSTLSMWAIELLWGVLLLEIAESLWENTDDLEVSLSDEAEFLQITVDIYQICATHNVSIIFYFWIGHSRVTFLIEAYPWYF